MDLLEIGHIGKPHGLRGELAVTITSDRPERTEIDAIWIIGDTPMRIRTIRPHRNRWIVGFHEIDDRDAAEELTGSVVRAEPITDPDALFVHELIGAELHTVDGHAHGRIVSVVANPADDLLELEDGSLVPAGFITDRSDLPDRIVVDVPDGLLTDSED